MISGMLREKIGYTYPSIITNDYGEQTETWSEPTYTRAQVTYKSGNRANENNEIVFNYEVDFSVWLYNNIDERCVILWGDKRYRILAIERQLKQQRLVIRTELINE